MSESVLCMWVICMLCTDVFMCACMFAHVCICVHVYTCTHACYDMSGAERRLIGEPSQNSLGLGKIWSVESLRVLE